jgi:glycopeptide antibiotics resistance protein
MYIDKTYLFIIGIPILIIIEILRFLKYKKTNLREVFVIIFSIYLMCLIAVTLLPFTTSYYFTPTANLVPVLNILKDISNTPPEMKAFMTRFWIKNLLGNLFLLSPLAAIVPIVFKKFRSLKAVFLLCLFTSILIEFLQYLSIFCGNLRSVDIDDVILNTFGSLIGFGFYNIFSKKFPQLKDNLSLFK